ncbi:lantibiotic dehydratase family protein [Chryseobacterium sp. OV279]|uniref:lantibiotic dehydratase family protein n=1 Tax=Chryseobacterium sp. OV279 TaxID=1500285 RepID=UPI00091AFDEE|nr:lantibiotic dehydratase family protein [Chryseobacterium sp. OV279]SHF41277.1 Lantibiotic dehydratase, C terminus [Chryseobacterium sp. OV279]
MEKITYGILDKYALRTPLLSCNAEFFKTVSFDDLERLTDNPVFMEALYIASRDFYNTLISFRNTKNKLDPKAYFSILKYFSRMSTRCTPFGLFAGISVGTFTGEESKTVVGQINDFKNHVQLDMNILFSVIQIINQNKEVRKYLQYFPNTSISHYTYTDTLKYIEYKYISGIRNHLLTSIETSDILQAILEKTKDGTPFTSLVEMLVAEGFEEDDSNDFINELIDSQILISELEPYTTGDDILDFILGKIKDIPELHSLYTFLNEIKNTLSAVDTPGKTDNIEKYEQVGTALHSTEIKMVDDKNLFQSNLNTNLIQNTLSASLKKDLMAGVKILNKLGKKTSNPSLDQFKNTFYTRFQDQEVPILEVLDSDTGIPYGMSQNKTESPLLKGLHFKMDRNANGASPQDGIANSFLYKLSETYLSGSYSIHINDEDLKQLSDTWDDLPKTMSVSTEIYEKDQKPVIHISGCMGSSAANLLMRFSNSNKDVYDLCSEIIDKEDQYLNDQVVFAEITHLPESRVGNILLRPALRKYEIPYLAKSNIDPSCQISLDDLYVRLIEDRIVLKSKKLNKYVIPMLTNAHNYTNPFLLSIYRFLCDIQYQNTRMFLNFDWGALSRSFVFYPRIEYKNIIISKACWYLKPNLITRFKDKENLADELKKWRSEIKMPAEMVLVEADNKLYFNLENPVYQNLFIDILQKKRDLVLEEYLYSEYNSIVKNEKGEDYCNEFIFSLCQKQ